MLKGDSVFLDYEELQAQIGWFTNLPSQSLLRKLSDLPSSSDIWHPVCGSDFSTDSANYNSSSSRGSFLRLRILWTLTKGKNEETSEYKSKPLLQQHQSQEICLVKSNNNKTTTKYDLSEAQTTIFLSWCIYRGKMAKVGILKC